MQFKLRCSDLPLWLEICTFIKGVFPPSKIRRVLDQFSTKVLEIPSTPLLKSSTFYLEHFP